MKRNIINLKQTRKKDIKTKKETVIGIVWIFGI